MFLVMILDAIVRFELVVREVKREGEGCYRYPDIMLGITPCYQYPDYRFTLLSFLTYLFSFVA